MVDYGSRRILGCRVDATTYGAAAEALVDLVRAGHGGMVCVATAHMLMEAFDDPAFQRILNSSDLVTPDGMPLVWALRLLGIPEAERVYGPTLTLVACQQAAELGIPVGFYGGRPEVLETLLSSLMRRFPRLRVAFAASPPFRDLDEEEQASTREAIEVSGARILFVGLGCPRQERWMAAHRQALSCVMVGVGAAFDFISGAKPQAPSWLQRAGLEWLFRLACEPRRLARRYLVGNPRFLFHLLRELAQRPARQRLRE